MIHWFLNASGVVLWLLVIALAIRCWLHWDDPPP